MVKSSLPSWKKLILSLMVGVLASFLLWVPPAHAWCFLVWCPSDVGRGNSTRGPCSVSLVSLMPPRGVVNVEQPSFWFYLDRKPQETARKGKFMLLDDQKYPLWQQPVQFELPLTSGLVYFPLPPLVAGKSLEPGKPYYWYFSVVCDEQKPSRNPGVKGAIQVLPATAPGTDADRPWRQTIAQLKTQSSIEREKVADLLQALELKLPEQATIPIRKLQPLA